jgi:hypothetical protein
MISPREAVDIVNARFGAHAGRRALHAKGSWCEGTFTATPAAARLSRAAHLQGEPVPVLARVSNGGGDPGEPDYAPDVRGLAVSFTLPDASATDMVAQSIPRFFQRTPEEFAQFIRASTGAAAAVRLPLYLATHPKAVRSLPTNASALRPVACIDAGVLELTAVVADPEADGGLVVFDPTRYRRTSWTTEALQSVARRRQVLGPTRSYRGRSMTPGEFFGPCCWGPTARASRR